MQVKDLSVKMNFPPVNDKSKACQVTIENKSADTLEAADIEFLVASGQTVKGNDHFVVKRQDDTYVVGHLPKGVVLPAHSKYTFDLEVTPPLTSERHPEYFYIGFEGGRKVESPIYAHAEWPTGHNVEYGSCRLTLKNQSKIELINPLITFETLKGNTFTNIDAMLDTQLANHKAISTQEHQLTYAEFKGGVDQVTFKPNSERVVTFGINKGSSSKPVALPEHVWVGFEVKVERQC